MDAATIARRLSVGLALGAFCACSGDEDGSSSGGSGSAGGTAQAGTGAAAGSQLGGSGGETGGTGGTAFGGAGGTGATGGTSATGGTGGSSGSGGTGGSSHYQGGYVSVMQSIVTVSGTDYASYSFSAGFSRTPIDSGSSACDIRTEGSCQVMDCASTSDAGVPSYETVSAGVVQLTGASQPLTLTPDASGTYAVVTGQEKLWSGGETLTVTAAGDEVPGFQATLFAAVPVVVTSPVFPALGAPITLQTKGPLTVSWTGGMGGTVTLMLVRSVGTKTVQVICSYPATVGSGTVPASAMASIPPGPDGVFQVLGGDAEKIDASGWAITVQEYVPGVTPAGGAASVMATFE